MHDEKGPTRSQTAPRTPRLRTRIVIGIGAVALSLSMGLGMATYFTVRTTVLQERESIAVHQLAANTQLLSPALLSGGVDEIQLLGGLRPQVRSFPLLERNDQWFTTSLQIGPEQLPASLIESVRSEGAARQRFSIEGDLMLGIGVVLPDGIGTYFEVFPLAELNSTLATLRNTLLTIGGLSTGIGLALGWWIAKRVTSPLRSVSTAAERIADGQLDTRLDSSADRDLQALIASFNRMADSLTDRISRERRFAADVSHELRSPLTTLLTSAAVLENRRHELSSEGREALDLLTADIHRFHRMVADLIEIAKHDAGIADLSMAYIVAPDFVLRTLQRLRVDESLLEIGGDAEGAVVRADELRLDRALGNLIENASLYGDGVTAVSVDATDAVIRIAVEDSGPGIPEVEREQIFERFARGTHGRRRANLTGSGLGLALTAENVAMMNGRIWAEDGADGGARIVIELPRVQP